MAVVSLIQVKERKKILKFVSSLCESSPVTDLIYQSARKAKSLLTAVLSVVSTFLMKDHYNM